MKNTLRFSVLCAFLALAGMAKAATLTLPSFTVSGPSSTAITCTAISSSLVAPVASGTTLSTCTVAPTGWSGAIALTNPQLAVASFQGNTFNLVVGATPLQAGTYGETVTSTP